MNDMYIQLRSKATPVVGVEVDELERICHENNIGFSNVTEPVGSIQNSGLLSWVTLCISPQVIEAFATNIFSTMVYDIIKTAIKGVISMIRANSTIAEKSNPSSIIELTSQSAKLRIESNKISDEVLDKAIDTFVKVSEINRSKNDNKVIPEFVVIDDYIKVMSQNEYIVQYIIKKKKQRRKKMNKLKMQTANKADENFKKLAAMFPNAVTETIDENGEVVRAIDKDVLMQEISCKVVDGNEERYQFTWPDKKKSVLLANAPINKTLRPCREESVDFDNTENLYIEGDNLEVLKLLQETYLGKIKMIYIDPPYNTGNDFVYEDDFAQSTEEYLESSGQFDGSGNRLVQNTESNGRFHTDWLNMIYPRLKLAKDLLSDDGVIFISIDDNEYENQKRVCDEIFGSSGFIATVIRNTNSSKNQSLFISVSHEYCLVYAKNIEILKSKHAVNKWSVPKNNIKEYLQKVKQLQSEGLSSEEITDELKTLTKYPRFIDFTNYWYFDKKGLYRKDNIGGVKNGNMTPLMNPLTGKPDPVPPGGYRYNTDKLANMVANNQIHFHTDGSLPTVKRYLSDYNEQRPKSIMSDDQRPDYSLMEEFNTPFDNPKQLAFILRICGIADKDSIFLDFFSGSATTAHAVMQLNAEDGGNRKFIMVQLPEETEEKSEAYKAGYKNICEIGKERIRRATKKIAEENPEAKFDGGFRVLKCDTSNMKEVYYNPAEYEPSLFSRLEDNIKEDRTPEDLLFQVMLDLGILLSSKIQCEVWRVESGAEYKYFNVEDGYLIACFDKNVTEELITEIAKQKPYYFVMRDSSMANDSVATNFEQIFAAYSPDTVRKVL